MQPKSALLHSLRQKMRLGHFSRRTEDAYAGWVRRFVRYHGLRHPTDMAERGVLAFLTHLAANEKLAAATQAQAAAALIFLYKHVVGRPLSGLGDVPRARAPVRLPVVLSEREVGRVLAALDGDRRLVGMLLYGSGLRLLECLSLRVKDIDRDRGEIRIRRAKGNRDRVTMLPRAASGLLGEHLRGVRAIYEQDVADGSRVELPNALERKYPSAGQEWAWYWVFPARRRYAAADGTVRRHHLHESVIQRSMAAAVRRSGIGKRASCHTLRHCFATHLLGPATTSGRCRSFSAIGMCRRPWCIRTY